MRLNLTDISSEPLQSQIARQIRAMILAGDLCAGQAISSIRVLARENRVSVITVQRAYENLEREGLIHSRRGKGFFISELNEKDKKQMARERLMETIEPLIKNALSEGLSPIDVESTIQAILDKIKKIIHTEF
jgi:GntR family transcriptional regulator